MEETPGTTLETNPGIGEFLGLLAAASEDVGVAALEAHDGLAGAGLGDEQGVEFLLGDGVLLGALAAVNDLGGPGREAQEVGVDQGVGTTTSARPSNSAPRMVSRPASPGPAPTR